MKTKDLTGTLEQHPFFQGMPIEHRSYMAGCAHIKRYKSGDFLMLLGKDADEFYLLRNGKVAIEMDAGNRTYLVQTVADGGIVGWSWLSPPLSIRYDVRAITDVSVLAFDAKCVREKCVADTDFGFQVSLRFMQIVIERLMATRIQLAELYA